MKTLFLVLNLLLILSFHAQENKVTKPEQITTATGWPTDIDGLITHLNSWDKQELDTYEQQDRDTNIKTSGETNAWIAEHKKLLKDMNATIVWNKRKKEYELVKK